MAAPKSRMNVEIRRYFSPAAGRSHNSAATSKNIVFQMRGAARWARDRWEEFNALARHGKMPRADDAINKRTVNEAIVEFLKNTILGGLLCCCRYCCRGVPREGVRHHRQNGDALVRLLPSSILVEAPDSRNWWLRRARHRIVHFRDAAARVAFRNV